MDGWMNGWTVWCFQVKERGWKRGWTAVGTLLRNGTETALNIS